MGSYKEIEGPLNLLARSIWKQQERGEFLRLIRVTGGRKKDISISQRYVRIHRDTIEGADLLSLINRVIVEVKYFESIKYRRHREAIESSRTSVRITLAYLHRRDPDFQTWISNTLANLVSEAQTKTKAEHTNGKMYISQDSTGRRVQLPGSPLNMLALPPGPST